jgi:hypothetical protein
MRAQLFWGLLLLGVGAVLLLNNLNLIPQNIADLWPVPVVLVGLWLLVSAARRPRGRGLTAAIVVSAIGMFWLAESLNWITEDLFLPVLLMSIGLGIVLRGLFFRGDSALY